MHESRRHIKRPLSGEAGPALVITRDRPLSPFQRSVEKAIVPRLPFLGFRPAVQWVYPPWRPAGSRRTMPFLSPFRSSLASS